MSDNQPVMRDERTVSVENAGSRLACAFLTFALLIDAVYRGQVRNEAAWDLLAMVIVSGFIQLVYQGRHKTLPRGWAWKMGIIAIVGGIFAALMVLAKTIWF